MNTAEAVTRRLDLAVQDLIGATEKLGPELYHVPGEDAWSAMQNLAHVAEFVPFWAQRARDVALGRVAMFGRTPEEWDQRAAAVAAHARDDLPNMLSSLRAALEVGRAALGEIPDDAWSREADLEPSGPRWSVATLVEQRLIGHVEAHGRQATEAAQHVSAAGRG